MDEEEKKATTSRPEGWARLLAQTEPMRDLIEFAGSLPASMPDQEMRQLIGQRATEVGVSLRGMAEAALPLGTPSEVLDEDAEQALHLIITALFSHFGPKTVWEIVSTVERVLPWSELVTSFVMAQASGDEDSEPLRMLMDGQVFSGVMFSQSESPLPYVVACSTPKTTRPVHIENYKATMREAFDGIPNPHGDTVAFLAECLEIRDANLVSGGAKLEPAEIARVMVYRQYPEAKALDEQAFLEDYGDVYVDLHSRVRQAFARDARRVTETAKRLSQPDS